MIQTEAQNFKDIFNWERDGKMIHGIVIPKIQRDYAQGRMSEEVTKIRSRFLQVIYDALVSDKKLTLDFVYGSIENGVLLPLDGQQRLTTLFLLHTYIAKHEDVAPEDYAFLRQFSYQTRVSSRDFCEHLVKFDLDFSKQTLSEQITDEAWFLLEWESDPTVQSMLVMLDHIHELFHTTSGLWPKVTGDSITFYFLAIDEMGLTDELYIKMNSRGKPLSRFENWKAELELAIKAYDPELSKRIAAQIDREWTDMLWPYRNSGTGNEEYDNVIDDEFLHFVHFVSDMLQFEKGEPEIEDDFHIIECLFSSSCPEAEENVEFMESMFNLWHKVSKEQKISCFFQHFLASKHEAGKVVFGKDTDLFADCCRNSGLKENKRRKFAYNRFLMLYCFVLYLQHKESIAEDDFRRRLRIVANLIKNSADTLRADFIAAIMKQTREIIVEGKLVEKDGKQHYNNNQVGEERDKLQWTNDNPKKAELLYELEDHPLLNGCIGVLDLENIEELHTPFLSVFSVNENGKYEFDAINRALLATGDYHQKDGWRKRIGTSSNDHARMWMELFGPENKAEREKTKQVLILLLRNLKQYDKKALDEVAHRYIMRAKELTWRYYLVKYGVMRKESLFGKYYWRNDNQYSLIMMTTEFKFGYNYDIFLKTLYDLAGHENLELGNYAYSKYENEGAEKLFMPSVKKYLTVEADCYKVFDYSDDENEVLVETIAIPQQDGIDTTDRIEIGLNIINRYLNLWKEDVVRGFVNRLEWTFAKSMPTCPHEYVVKETCSLTKEEFRYFVLAQRSSGNHEIWGAYKFPYLYIDGYKYWTMGCSMSETIIINRAKV